MRIKLFTTEAERQRARTRTVVGFFKAITVTTLVFISVVAVHYLLGWW